MKIYTKTGDLGETSLIGGVRVKKSNIRIDAYGTVDELNSWIGVIRNIDVLNNPLIFQNIQDLLFTVGSHLASHPEKGRMKLPEILESDIVLLENEIDKMELELAPLSQFCIAWKFHRKWLLSCCSNCLSPSRALHGRISA
jgi:cob(I)alamin adenosyltransferase